MNIAPKYSSPYFTIFYLSSKTILGLSFASFRAIEAFWGILVQKSINHGQGHTESNLKLSTPHFYLMRYYASVKAKRRLSYTCFRVFGVFWGILYRDTRGIVLSS